jgi:hypothetical protein
MPPSGVVLKVPLAFSRNANRASRTGLLAEMKKGMVLVAPSSEATAICGLVLGLVPPVAGWA